MKALNIVTMPLRILYNAIHRILTRIRRITNKYPTLSFTALFVACAVINLITGLWWIGVAVFVMCMILFSSTSTMSGTLRTITAGTEVGYASILAVGAAMLVSPVGTYWMWYLLVPISLWAVKTTHDVLAFTTLSCEMRGGMKL